MMILIFWPVIGVVCGLLFQWKHGSFNVLGLLFTAVIGPASMVLLPVLLEKPDTAYREFLREKDEENLAALQRLRPRS